MYTRKLSTTPVETINRLTDSNPKKIQIPTRF